MHAIIYYEKQDGSFVRDEHKHVAENATEQALVSSVSNVQSRLMVTRRFMSDENARESISMVKHPIVWSCWKVGLAFYFDVWMQGA